jgi:hypothetical protein
MSRQWRQGLWNTGTKVNNLKDWEHNLLVDKYADSLEKYKEEIKVWKKSKGKYYYYILQHCPPELKTGLKT